MTSLLAWTLGPMELVIILVIVLLLFGSTKIPNLMRGLGQGINEFKKGIKEGDKPDEHSDEKETKPPAS
jgi:sec-independent protein translocase protein TatA